MTKQLTKHNKDLNFTYPLTLLELEAVISLIPFFFFKLNFLLETSLKTSVKT